MNTGIYIVIPAFNEGAAIAETIHSVQQCGFSSIIVIDDGSRDNTHDLAQKEGAQVFRHKINRGKGAAVKTGIEAAKRMDAKIVVVMDADGQHAADDLQAVLKPLREKTADVVLGTRSFNTTHMPFSRVVANKAANVLTRLATGHWIQDSQSGFRAYSKLALEKIETQADTYEYETEVIRQIKQHNLRFVEVPIQTRYTKHSTSKPHRQGFVNGAKALYKMVWSRLS